MDDDFRIWHKAAVLLRQSYSLYFGEKPTAQTGCANDTITKIRIQGGALACPGLRAGVGWGSARGAFPRSRFVAYAAATANLKSCRSASVLIAALASASGIGTNGGRISAQPGSSR